MYTCIYVYGDGVSYLTDHDEWQKIKALFQKVWQYSNKMLDFVRNKYTYVSGKEKNAWKNALFFHFQERLHIQEEKETRVRNMRICRKKIKRLFDFFFLSSSGIMAEKSLLILCFRFKLYLRKNCFFGKNILLVSWPKCHVFAFSIAIIATATPANSTFICIRENMGTNAGINFVSACQ